MNEFVISQVGNFIEVDFVAASKARKQARMRELDEARKLRMATKIEQMLKNLII